MLNIETEVKVLEKDHKDYHDHILSLGGKPIFPQLIITEFYKHPDQESFVRFRIVESSAPGLFVRYGDSEMTIKRVTSGDSSVTTYIEETEYVDDKIKRHIMKSYEALGFTRRCSMKIRYKYALNNSVLDFDRELEADIPEYLEIEGSSHEIEDILRSLEIPATEKRAYSSEYLYRHYGVKMPSEFSATKPLRP